MDGRQIQFRVGGELFGVGIAAKPGRALGSERYRMAAGLTILHARNIQAFRHGGHAHHGGVQWKPRSPAYARRMAKLGKTRLLVVSGTLRESVRFSAPTEPTRYFLRVGVEKSVLYARHVNQTRTVLFMGTQDRRDMLAETRRLMDGAIGAHAKGGR